MKKRELATAVLALLLIWQAAAWLVNKQICLARWLSSKLSSPNWVTAWPVISW